MKRNVYWEKENNSSDEREKRNREKKKLFSEQFDRGRVCTIKKKEKQHSRFLQHKDTWGRGSSLLTIKLGAGGVTRDIDKNKYEKIRGGHISSSRRDSSSYVDFEFISLEYRSLFDRQRSTLKGRVSR